MNIHHPVPASLLFEEARFAANLRAIGVENEICDPGILLYRKIVRENIYGVLQDVFPLFCRQFDGIRMRVLTEDFLYHHHASQPEFHQLATEWLLFIRQRSQMLPHNLALLEYEWLIYAIEINSSDVPLPQKMTLSPDDITAIEVIPNPTLKIIALPFLIKDGEPYYDDAPPPYYYAIYRKHNNEIYQKHLNHLDIQLLSSINEHTISANLLQQRCSHDFQNLQLSSWLEENNNDELIYLTCTE